VTKRLPTIFDRYEEAYKSDPKSEETFLLEVLCESVRNGRMTDKNAKISHTYWKKASRSQ